MYIKLERRYWIAIVAIAIVAATILTVTATALSPRTLTPLTVAAYYVDNHASTDGNGSLESPWNNIAGHVNDLAAGDTMSIRGDTSLPGRVYAEDVIEIGGASGTAGLPITIRNYPGEIVILHGGNVDYSFVIRSVNHWHLDGLIFDGGPSLTRAMGIYGADYIVIRNCEIRNGRRFGIDIGGHSDHTLIEDCQIYNFQSAPGKDSFGIVIAPGPNANTVIRGNTIYDITGDCIRLWTDDSPQNEITDTLIENNHLYTTLGGCSEDGVDIGSGNAEHYTILRTTVRGNVAHGFHYCDGSCGGSGGGGSGFGSHGETKGVVFEGNEIYDSASGICINTDDVRIVNNLIHDMLLLEPGAWLNAGIYVHHTGLDNPEDIVICNNTLVNLPEHLWYFGKYSRNLIIKNNLAYQTNAVHVADTAQYVADYNGWFSVAQTLPGMHDTTGTDPLLTSNYRLTANSPARGAGENGVDLGAFPYEPGGPTPTPLPTATPYPPQPTHTPGPTGTPGPTATPDDVWWKHCTPCPTYPVQPTYTPWPTPTCRPCASPTLYPTSTPYPPQP